MLPPCSFKGYQKEQHWKRDPLGLLSVGSRQGGSSSWSPNSCQAPVLRLWVSNFQRAPLQKRLVLSVRGGGRLHGRDGRRIPAIKRDTGHHCLQPQKCDSNPVKFGAPRPVTSLYPGPAVHRLQGVIVRLSEPEVTAWKPAVVGSIQNASKQGAGRTADERAAVEELIRSSTNRFTRLELSAAPSFPARATPSHPADVALRPLAASLTFSSMNAVGARG